MNKKVLDTEDEKKEGFISLKNIDIAQMAFFKLYSEKKKDAALRLAYRMISYTSINLDISAIDWEIYLALLHCGASFSMGQKYFVCFNFYSETRISQKLYAALCKQFYE